MYLFFLPQEWCHTFFWQKTVNIIFNANFGTHTHILGDWILDKTHHIIFLVVVVVMTSPSGNCLYGGTKMSRRDEEIHQTPDPEGSVSPL